MTRVQYKNVTEGETEFSSLNSVLSLLSYMLKAPLVKPGTDVVNSLGRQRNALEMFLKACLGLEGGTDLLLKVQDLVNWLCRSSDRDECFQQSRIPIISFISRRAFNCPFSFAYLMYLVAEM